VAPSAEPSSLPSSEPSASFSTFADVTWWFSISRTVDRSVDENLCCGSIVTAPTHWSIATSPPGSTGIEPRWFVVVPTNGAAGVERSHVTSPTLSQQAPFHVWTPILSNEGGYPTNYVEHVQSRSMAALSRYSWTNSATSHLATSSFDHYLETTSGIIAGDLNQSIEHSCRSTDKVVDARDITGWAFDNVKISGATTQPPARRPQSTTWL
jgi:hypothetical protein